MNKNNKNLPQVNCQGDFLMSKFKVDIPGVDTNNLTVLKNEEMLLLFKQFKNGDKSAKEKLINGNLKLVLSIISKFKYKNIDMNDLFQVGCIGLIKAVENFDITYGVMFSTYAVPLILGEVKRLIRTNNPLRIARSIRDLAFDILQFIEEYNRVNGIEPSNEIIARELHIEEYEIKNALDALNEPVSIYEPVYSDGGDTILLLDQLADGKSQIYDKDMFLAMNEALKKLKKRERDVLVNRYIIGKTQSEIAEDLCVSQAQISRIEKSAINNMKKMLD